MCSRLLHDCPGSTDLCTLIDKLKTRSELDWYLALAAEHNGSRNVLVNQIETRANQPADLQTSLPNIAQIEQALGEGPGAAPYRTVSDCGFYGVLCALHEPLYAAGPARVRMTWSFRQA